MVPSIFYFSKRFITKGRNLESCNFLYISHRCWEKSANRVFGYKRFKISIDCLYSFIDKNFFPVFPNSKNRTEKWIKPHEGQQHSHRVSVTADFLVNCAVVSQSENWNGWTWQLTGQEFVRGGWRSE